MRFFCAAILVLGLAVPAQAAADEEQGWSFSGAFSGSSNSSGVVTKLDPVLGYNFNKHFSTYTGVPFYFVNLSSSATTVTTNGGSMNGIGNAFLGFRARTDSEVLNYSSTLEFTAPTGDKSRGFSTGRMTVDWTNRFSRQFSSLTPFASVGVANTVSDTAFFVRPFSSLGTVGHFEGGATYDVAPLVRVGASAYAVRGSGEQRIISKIKRSLSSQGPGSGRPIFETLPETVSTADAINDHGLSTWFAISPKSVNLYAGYSRSVNYDFNTLFFGVGFHLGR